MIDLEIGILHIFLPVQLWFMMTYRRKTQKTRSTDLKNRKEMNNFVYVCIHANGYARHGTKPISTFQKSEEGLCKTRENCEPCTITQIVCVSSFEFSVGIGRPLHLILDQKLDQILVPYLFLVFSINI